MVTRESTEAYLRVAGYMHREELMHSHTLSNLQGLWLLSLRFQHNLSRSLLKIMCCVLAQVSFTTTDLRYDTAR